MKKYITYSMMLALSLSMTSGLSHAADKSLPVVSGTAAVHHFVGEELLKNAKVGLPKARATALKALPGGKITDEELEVEKGGSGLRYSFDIKKDKIVYEVGVDAGTGKVLENAKEGKNPD